MARCIFENLTEEQAVTFAQWFDGQGEQDCDIWFDDREIKSPMTGKISKLENGDVVVTCK